VVSLGHTPEVTMPGTVGRTSEQFAVELDGASVGLVKSVEGGAASADVVAEQAGPDGIVHKHVGGLHYDDITLTCGTGMSSGFYTWIADTLNRRYSRKNGAVVVADFNYREVSRLSFQQALLSAIALPALDASSKEPAYLTVRIAPESTRRTTGQGPEIDKTVRAQKQLLQANFRLDIPGLDCTRVTAIDEILIRQTLVEDPVGALREYQKEPGNLEIPNLAVVLQESRAASFYDWFEDFVIKGNNGAGGEKTGTLAYLAPNGQDALFTLDFHGLGIFKLTPLKFDSARESARLVRAEMYCEEISFKYDASVASTSTSTAAPQTGSTETTSQNTAGPAIPATPINLPADVIAARRGSDLKPGT
jgi:phage tail-like protein